MKTLKLDLDRRGVARVTLARPEKRNAIDAQMIAELTEIAGEIGASDAVRVVVLSGQGEVFCAGGDLDWMRAQSRADLATREREARALASMLGAWNALPKPVIGRIRGAAYGGGVGLMAVCDIVVGTKSAEYALSETKLGLIPATIGPYVVARIGVAAARRLMMSSRVFWSEEAIEVGLVSHAVRVVDLDGEIERQIAPFLKCAPGAVAETKALIGTLGATVSPEAVEASIAALMARWGTQEAEEGIKAFFHKRPPKWDKTDT